MIPRCAFFFENPNMAAVLFVQVALVGLALRTKVPRLGGVLAFAAALAVVLTGSRGGLVALVSGFVVLAWTAWRRRVSFRPSRVGILALVVLALVLVAGGLGARFCALPKDASVANRLLIWRTVPRMMAEAPDGWGLGNSGRAFMDWYQPLDRHEEYRTLVGSHQTWLVELGWLGRYAYLLGWVLVLAVAFRGAHQTGDAHPAAQWTALAVAATCSSVLEQVALWCVPVGVLVWAVARRHLRPLSPVQLLVWALLPLVPLVAVRLLADGGNRFGPAGERAFWAASGGGPTRETWLVPDERVLGAHYPRRLRAAGKSVSVVHDLDHIGPEARCVYLCGAERYVPLTRFPPAARIIYLSPRFRPLKLDASREEALLGEFADDVPDPVPAGVRIIPGAADYLEPPHLDF